ncbi:hypothetical protein Airi02_009560 [Actinoallomurus iriomotensis]|uniref:Uncharacterized protein n=1 Tax=Actinoallomurus iriomotensis TaxID=478107 RepID=A0A9W6RWE1_9ACTN|nr:hypothetical protein Airi02_009560 [Actinoallomurus iriomotensis]
MIVERVDHHAERHLLLELGRPARQGEHAVAPRTGDQLGEESCLSRTRLAGQADQRERAVDRVEEPAEFGEDLAAPDERGVRLAPWARC